MKGKKSRTFRIFNSDRRKHETDESIPKDLDINEESFKMLQNGAVSFRRSTETMNTVDAENAENDNMGCSFKITINSDQNNDDHN